jgi:hypothetical protein
MHEARKYRTATSFRQGLEERLNSQALSQGKDVMRLRRQLAFDRLLARMFDAPDSPWLLKGGYVMELRVKQARATKDLDLGLKSIPREPLRKWVEAAAAIKMDDFFVFKIGPSTMDLEAAPYGGERFPVEANMDGRPFIKFHVDIAKGDDGLEPNEKLVGHDWLSFAGLPAPEFIAIPTPQHFAEKLHAYTQVRAVPNSRVKDLVDMVLLIQLGGLEPARVQVALAKTFVRRNAHPIPFRLDPPPPAWEVPFQALAEECGLDMDFHQAFAILSAFYQSLRLEKRDA